MGRKTDAEIIKAAAKMIHGIEIDDDVADQLSKTHRERKRCERV